MGLLDNLGTRYENLKKDNRLHQSGEINAAQAALRTAGETIGGIGDIAMAPISPLVPEFVKEGFGDLVSGVMSTGPAKTAMAWAKKNPEQARDVMSALNASALIPGGALVSAGKKAVTYGPQATKGAALSNISNYINNWYGPGKDFAGTAAEAAAKKAGGFAETAGTGLLGMIGHAVSPKSKALYGEQGITVPAQKIVQGHLDNIPTDTRALSKGVGQVQYGKHINAQSGRQGGTNAAADEIANRSFLQQHTPNTPGSIQQALNQHGVGMDDLIDTRKKKLESGAKEWRSLPNVPANPNDSRFVEKYLNDVMKFDQFVVKSPSNVQTGGHYSDIMHKNPAGPEIKAAFNLKKAPRNPDGTVDLNWVSTRLQERQAGANKKLPKGAAWRVVTKDPESIARDGLWLRGSKVGSSITEGGVGWLMKIEPDGTLTGYMFDKHDFLEKVPGVNVAAQKLLPNDVIAVTPAMKTQIKVPGVKGKHFKQTPQNTGTQDTMEALLQQYATAVPSKQNLRGEQMQMGGRALQMGGLLGASENR